jgi:hypothetical protein
LNNLVEKVLLFFGSKSHLMRLVRLVFCTALLLASVYITAEHLYKIAVETPWGAVGHFFLTLSALGLQGWVVTLYLRWARWNDYEVYFEGWVPRFERRTHEQSKTFRRRRGQAPSFKDLLHMDWSSADPGKLATMCQPMSFCIQCGHQASDVSSKSDPEGLSRYACMNPDCIVRPTWMVQRRAEI